MAYNQLNKLRMYSNIIDLAMKHYEVGITHWKGIWKKHIYPVYPISYSQFMKILSEPRLAIRIREAEEKQQEKKDK